jgi:hypothetical protein
MPLLCGLKEVKKKEKTDEIVILEDAAPKTDWKSIFKGSW